MVNDEQVYPVAPDQIDASRHLADAFDNLETEVSAGYIVRMMQERGRWEPFSRAEIEDFYQRSGHNDGFTFNRLIEPRMAFSIKHGLYLTGGGWVIEMPNGKLAVTEDFVARVYKSSPRVSVSQKESFSSS